MWHHVSSHPRTCAPNNFHPLMFGESSFLQLMSEENLNLQQNDLRRSSSIHSYECSHHSDLVPGRIESDDEYDSELDDFIDDGPEETEDYSKHIREIFGYDKSKYNDFDEDDECMESNFGQVLKEEFNSAKIGKFSSYLNSSILNSCRLANTLVVLSSTAEDGEIELTSSGHRGVVPSIFVVFLPNTSAPTHPLNAVPTISFAPLLSCSATAANPPDKPYTGPVGMSPKPRSIHYPPPLVNWARPSGHKIIPGLIPLWYVEAAPSILLVPVLPEGALVEESGCFAPQTTAGLQAAFPPPVYQVLLQS
uniref:Uncharacterized protein n=1 Tax=Timema douglasi TaxID=61478 RepID=A0A7R8VRP3_TIMDO|nr:unnamed protein product [Timema douglasi]